jgi:hypothetical protein
MSYIDLLDTVKTAHPNKFATEWWRKSSPEIQANAISLAQTELMLRILHGETILLSNNQAFDSVAFLDSVSEMVRLDSLDRPPVALSYYKFHQPGVVSPTEYTPEALIDLGVEYLAKEVFIFSAWLGMDENIAIRNRMSEALKNGDDSRRFISMVDVVYHDLDSDVRDDFQKQARGLQNFYNYLRRLYPLGKRVVRVAGKSDRLIWRDLDSLRYSPSKGIPVEAIKRLDEELFAHNLHGSREDRSVLYRLIENFGSPLRDDLRKYIDIFYNQKIGASVSPRGRGIYSVMDHNPKTPSSYEEQILENAEALNIVDGIVAEEALEVFPPKEASSLNYLTWDDVIGVMTEEKSVCKSAYELQDDLALYNQLNPTDPDFNNKLTDWKKMTSDSLESHQTLLASILGKKIKYDSGKKTMFSITIPRAKFTITALGGLVGGVVGYLSQNSLLFSAVGATTASALTYNLTELAEKSLKDKLESTAITRVREDLRECLKTRQKGVGRANLRDDQIQTSLPDRPE